MWKMREKLKSPHNTHVSDFGIKRIGTFYYKSIY